MDTKRNKVLGVTAIAIAGIACLVIGSVHHLSADAVLEIAATAGVSAALSGWLIDKSIATAVALPAIGIAGTVGELVVASSPNVAVSDVDYIGLLACGAIAFFGFVLKD